MTFLFAYCNVVVENVAFCDELGCCNFTLSSFLNPMSMSKHQQRVKFYTFARNPNQYETFCRSYSGTWSSNPKPKAIKRMISEIETSKWNL